MEKEVELFINTFKTKPEFLLDTGGRFEIIGNHTDHNHGLCLVANCSLRAKAALSYNKDIIEVQSEGYKKFSFKINDLANSPIAHGTPMLCKGILFKLKELGYKIGGFKMSIVSELPDGSGVSSSAAIESLFGYAVSYLFNEGKISPLEIAKTGQFSENVYFKKPCGLLDQIGTSFDSSNFIDFKNIDNPIIETLPFDLPLTLYLIKSLGNHSRLTPLYAAIPASMKEVAKLLDNKEFLRDVKDDKDILFKIDALNLDEEIKRKAKHFFIENENVKHAKKAIETKDLEEFLKAIRASQESSKNNLENTFVKGEYEGSPQSIIDELTPLIKDNGAIRIHGGGFKGTVLAFIKNDYCEAFDKILKEKYSEDRYFKVHISSKAANFKKL